MRIFSHRVFGYILTFSVRHGIIRLSYRKRCFTMPIILIVAAAIVILFIVFIFATGYVKAPPNIAYIISGFKKEPRVLIGRAGIRIPFLERKDALIVKQISIDIKTNGYIPTQDFIGVDIDAVAKIRVKTDKEGIALAMKNFLNMKEEQIITALTDSLQGNMRESATCC